MAFFCKCGEEIPAKRLLVLLQDDLPLFCFACGQINAKKEIVAKSKRIGQGSNKQGYEYLGDPESAARKMLDVGRKDGLSLQRRRK